MPDATPRVIKDGGGSGIKTYSPGELKLLAAEGRSKSNGISSLVSLRHPKSGSDQPVSRALFSEFASRTPCWTDPVRLLDTFLDLAQTHSPSGQESDVADYVQNRLDTIGFETTRDSVGNLIGILPANSTNAPNLMFTAHMDCVYPGNEAPVEPVLYRSGDIGTDGRNSLGADDKAGIAGVLATLEFTVNGRISHGEIKAIFTIQEELGWRGIKQIPASILNGIHLVLAMDPPVRVERDETGFMAVLHVAAGPPFEKLARSSARRVSGEPKLLYSEDGYVGGDTICISPLGAIVIDFCSGSRYPHTTHEHLRFEDLARQTSRMIATTEEILRADRRDLDMRTVYGDEPIGQLTGVRKQLPLTPDFLRERIEQAQTIHTESGPAVAQALSHLSAMAPRAGDPELLSEVVNTFTRCLRVDQVPQVQRALASSLTHLATNLADIRPLGPLVSVARDLIERGGDDAARVQAVHFLEEIYAKERRVVEKSKLVRTFILFLQSGSERVHKAIVEFFRVNLNDTIHELTVAFCNRNRSAWERLTSEGRGRVIDGRTRDTIQKNLFEDPNLLAPISN
jgi:hypothetical protein